MNNPYKDSLLKCDLCGQTQEASDMTIVDAVLDMAEINICDWCIERIKTSNQDQHGDFD